MKLFSILPLLGILASSTLSGQILYNQSFNYDVSKNGLQFNDTNFPGEGWSSGTGVITYQHTAGLSYPGLTTSGGALQYNFTGGTGNRSATQTFSHDYASFSAGQVYEASALVRVDRALTAGRATTLSFNAAAVNTFSFRLTDSIMQATAWTNGSALTIDGPGYAVGDTLAFLIRITQGTGASPTDSQVEIWFNPDYNNLGTANFTSTSDTRIGRSGAGNAYTGVTFSSSVGDSSFTWDQVNMTAIPEPSTYAALLGLLAFGAVAWRRRK